LEGQEALPATRSCRDPHLEEDVMPALPAHSRISHGAVGMALLLPAALLIFACGGDEGPVDPGPTTGSLMVTVSTTGAASEADDYSVSIEGGAGHAFGVDGSVTITDLSPGLRSIALQGVAANCTVDGNNPRFVTVVAGETTETTFEVACAAPVLGDTIFAVDLANRLAMFGSESTGQVSRVTRIQGLPLFQRIVGMDWRHTDGKLYGVGSDSRVYIIDPQTATATPVGDEPFSPTILAFFDVHFGMAFDPATDRIRLVSAETERNWSIDPDNGTAVLGAEVRYAAGDPNEGIAPHISGLAFAPPAGTLTAGPSAFRLSGALECENLLYAIDPDIGWIVGTCDPDQADYVSLIDLNEFGQAKSTRCAEIEIAQGSGVDLAIEVMTYFDGRSHLDEYEILSDGTIIRHEGGTIELDSPAQDMVWCTPKCGSSDDR
jgi:hypothetical protein